jgi:hypothetical protein
MSYQRKSSQNFRTKGGFHDSPVIIFLRISKEKPPRGLYVASLDDYKQEEADSDSRMLYYLQEAVRKR